MKQPENLAGKFQSIIASLQKMEESAAVFSELSKISSEMAALKDYAQQGIKNLDLNFDTFTDKIELFSDLNQFQKEMLEARSPEKVVDAVFQVIEKHLPCDLTFMIYKLREEDTDYEILAGDKEKTDDIKKFVQSSKLNHFTQLFTESKLSHLINDVHSFHKTDINWVQMKARSAVIFPLKNRGNLLGFGFLIRQKEAFEIHELSTMNVFSGYISLLIYQNFYFALLKSRLIHQARHLKLLENVKYSEFFENGTIYLLTLDSRNTILHINKAVTRDFRLTEESLLGEDFFDIIPAAHRNAVRKSLEMGRGKPLQVFRSQLQNTYGKNRILEFMVSPLQVGTNSDLNLVLAADVTENFYEDQIKHRNEVLDEIDQFSRILVSQFNNLLTTIIPNISLLKKTLPAANGNQQKLDSIQKTAQRSANLVQKFLNYDVENRVEREEVNINRLLNSYVSSVKKELPNNIKFKVELDPAIKNIKIYPLKLRRIFDIIVSNSVIAVQGRSRPELLFSTTLIHQKRNGLLANQLFFLKAGKFIEICIRDNGVGIPAKSVNDVFKPFYSTRIKNEGVGLELFIAYNLVKEMKGHIFLDSQVDQYTSVYIFLPFKEEKEMSSPMPTIEKVESKSPDRPATILVVDDEYNIRSMMKEIMEMSGLKVFTAGNGRDGVEIYQRNREEIDLIIMDMVMPVMDGRAAFNEIRKINPQQKIFIISGYSHREDLQDIMDNGAVGFLRKPFQVKEIVEKVQEILELEN